MLFVFPESLPASRRAINKKGKNRAIEGDETGPSGKSTTYLISGWALKFILVVDEDSHTWVVTRVVKSFISPLAQFLPTDVPVYYSAAMPGHRYVRKDWSLTFLALSLFVHNLALGLFQLKYLYAEHVYDWAAEQLSYYISFMGAVRAFHLLVILPCKSLNSSADFCNLY